MHIAIVLGITAVVIFVLVKLYNIFSDKIKFFTQGLDHKFSLPEIRSLWKLSQICDLPEPQSLYWSVPALSRCITHIIETAQEEGNQDSPEVQGFLSKLYKFRTKIELDSEKKKGLDSTKDLDKGQKLRVIFPGKGLFESEILNSGRDLTIKLPTQKGVIKFNGDDWVNNEINIYLWRKGDANYVFDSRVLAAGVFNGQSALYVTHSEKMLRAQKRRSVRCECHVPAQLYIIKEQIINFSTVETSPGYRCILEDISEDGAMIRIGGKGVSNIQIKLQFELEDSFILMFGIIKAVEFNSEINQSRLHFECTHVEPTMKNFILSYVYKVLPAKQKEIFEALTETEKDAKEMGDSPEDETSEEDIGLENKKINEIVQENFNSVNKDIPINIDVPEAEEVE